MMTTGGMTRDLFQPRAQSLRSPGAFVLLALMAFLPSAEALARTPKARADAPVLPAGTALYLHLQTAVSTKTSKPGQPIIASLAREVEVESGVAIPFGSTFKGSVERCSQPITTDASDQRAQLLLNIGQLAIPGEGNFTLQGHVSGVINARETLLADGTIVGVLQSETPASLLSGVLVKLGQINSDVNDQIQRQKITQVNTAIELPVGTDIQFTLSEPLSLRSIVPSAGPPQLPDNLHAAVASVLYNAPRRAVNKTNRPGDPLNLVFVGTAQEIEQAFRQAGWTEPRRKNQKSIWKTAQAVINDDGYNQAPVSDLYLFGRREDLAFEKTLNTFNKRHHLRLWQTSASAPDGRPIWLGAATHDVGIDVHPGVVSHATDANLDDERTQVSSDLFLGGAVAAAELMAPPHPLSSGMTTTGGAWHTDGRLIVIDLKAGPGSPM